MGLRDWLKTALENGSYLEYVVARVIQQITRVVVAFLTSTTVVVPVWYFFNLGSLEGPTWLPDYRILAIISFAALVYQTLSTDIYKLSEDSS
jgi:uncharacterized membrane protein